MPQPPARREPPSRVVLIVDDDDDFRQTFGTALSKHGFEVLTAGSAEEAHRVVDSHEGGIDVLLMDIVLPDSWGASLAQGLVGTRPETRVIYTSGYAESDPIIRAGVDQDTLFLTKPFGVQELVETIEGTISSGPDER